MNTFFNVGSDQDFNLKPEVQPSIVFLAMMSLPQKLTATGDWLIYFGRKINIRMLLKEYYEIFSSSHLNRLLS